MNVSEWVEQNLAGPMLRLHNEIYQRTDGRIGHKVPGLAPMLLLHSTGAKSGQPRTNSLTYARDGDAYLIVASMGGSDRNPAWYHNLRAHPDVEINVGPKRFAVTARLVTPDDADYQRMWQLVNKNNADRYNAYQRKTSRPIPIFELKAKS
ncbi:MAG TPA: nitroreductase family deazaflavin-dependent oxidoreductase [Mycobacterium sp.]|nr:nitroreductase family deazaflavin-dependent oxidoreductase [Mycobacterium sp.]